MKELVDESHNNFFKELKKNENEMKFVLEKGKHKNEKIWMLWTNEKKFLNSVFQKTNNYRKCFFFFCFA